ncbi:putative transposase/invertase (TIGR01784 family) [Erwinia toletana]|uniref:Transposase/invertase (TIGR01784 family) n=1 Tax=Winslowiella toletana TaxID=92490 RepID=A0ABS4PDW8_9GAMM|nr:hypothetical protein [Winslowiella toletana]MBP2170825.1 putative transposase/invertase (TIGR01784 family) [Winslowiella toletana]
MAKTDTAITLLFGKSLVLDFAQVKQGQRAGQHKEFMMTMAEKLAQEGGQETKLEIALKMLAEGLKPSAVLKMTGLTEAELDEIRH